MPKTVDDKSLTYFNAPKTVDALNILTDYSYLGEQCEGESQTICKPSYSEKDFYWRQIGTLDDKKIIVCGMTQFDNEVEYYLLVNPANEITLLTQMGTVKQYYKNDSASKESLDKFKYAVSATVTLDESSVLPAIEFPKELKVAGQKFKSKEFITLMKNGLKSIRGTYKGDVNESDIRKIGEDSGKTFYAVTIQKEPTYTVEEYYATYQNIYSMPYSQNGEITASSDKKIALNWSTGENNVSGYYSAGRGCGTSNGFVNAKNIVKGTLVQVGTTPGKQKIYQLPTTHPLVKELFDKDYAKGEFLDDVSLKNLNVQQFSDKHAYILVENGLGEYLVFLRDDFFISGGCAKPVIYLYPQKDTDVQVAVGADVQISDPQYPKNGWQHVLAKPNGMLTYQGRSYGSLFWEGKGYGYYPEITVGTVVETSRAVATMRQQLQQQGFQGREIDEFIAFWEPNLPTHPFVRLTWLTTKQMDELAPLTIIPKPQTVIRIFLDFEGLSSKIAMPEQKLVTTKRSGFTVVEWGGLARNGLQSLAR